MKKIPGGSMTIVACLELPTSTDEIDDARHFEMTLVLRETLKDPLP
jgi:hypothetical protein